jgi:hypothetical protein
VQRDVRDLVTRGAMPEEESAHHARAIADDATHQSADDETEKDGADVGGAGVEVGNWRRFWGGVIVGERHYVKSFKVLGKSQP